MLIDVNDNIPQFINLPSSVDLLENTKPGVGIFNVEVGDDDSNEHGRVYLSLKQVLTHYTLIKQCILLGILFTR